MMQPELAPPAPVHTYNEWDPLEEVIVGRLEGATIPTRHVSFDGNLPSIARRLYRPLAGRRYPRILVRRAQRELDQLVSLIEQAGVVVRRPDIVDFSVACSTPNWRSKGFCIASPRDGLIVIGNEIIETPMAWRSRQFEMRAYKTLLKEYFERGARWTAAPRPRLLDSLYAGPDFEPGRKGEPVKYIIGESELVFDAADFVRCGRDLFVTRSNVTNRTGIDWLRRHLGDDFTIHEIESLCPQPMHIDTTFVPLAPGKVLVNPEYIDPNELPPVLKTWDVLVAPEPDPVPGFLNVHLSLVSKWITMNVLMLDEKRVIVEASQKRMHRALRDWGFEPVPTPFMNYKLFGGGFHCATLDIRRRGELQSYF